MFSNTLADRIDGDVGKAVPTVAELQAGCPYLCTHAETAPLRPAVPGFAGEQLKLAAQFPRQVHRAATNPRNLLAG
jgi:hypothetical protein